MIARFARGGLAYAAFNLGVLLGVVGGSVLTSLAFLSPTLFQAALVVLK